MNNNKIKKCTKCKEIKLLSLFFKDKSKKDGYRPDCKLCNTKIVKDYAQKNRENINFNNKKYTTGLSKKEYITILSNQNNGCAICGKTENENGKKLAVDHCHTNKYIRGLLCTNCNFALGYFKDNKELIKKALLYLDNNLSVNKITYKEWKRKELL